MVLRSWMCFVAVMISIQTLKPRIYLLHQCVHPLAEYLDFSLSGFFTGWCTGLLLLHFLKKSFSG